MTQTSLKPLFKLQSFEKNQAILLILSISEGVRTNSSRRGINGPTLMQTWLLQSIISLDSVQARNMRIIRKGIEQIIKNEISPNSLPTEQKEKCLINQGKAWLCLERTSRGTLEIKLNSSKDSFLFECNPSRDETETLKENMWLQSLDQIYNADCCLYFICSFQIIY